MLLSLLLSSCSMVFNTEVSVTMINLDSDKKTAYIWIKEDGAGQNSPIQYLGSRSTTLYLNANLDQDGYLVADPLTVYASTDYADADPATAPLELNKGKGHNPHFQITFDGANIVVETKEQG